MRTADDTALIVTWEYDPPINTVHYEIEYRAMSRANGGTVKVSNQLEVTEVIQGLVDASNYEVSIRYYLSMPRDADNFTWHIWGLKGVALVGAILTSLTVPPVYIC